MRCCVVASVLLPLSILVLPPNVAAQSPPNSTVQPVQPAAFNRAAATSPNANASVRFAKHAPRVGDQVEQSIDLEMRLTTSIRQGDQLAAKNTTSMRSRQRRAVTSTEILDGRTQAVLVRYRQADKQVTIDAGNGDAADNAPPTTQSESQPVEGKAYHCRREPGGDGKLLVTDADGALPPIEEFEIVAQNMDMVGRPNVLADFLAGRSVPVGQTLALPADVANRLFGLDARLGQVSRFELTLQEIRRENGRQHAVFAASVDASSNDSSQMRLQLEGPLVVDVDSCRPVQTRLAGPIAMTESRGTYSTAYQLISTGRMTVSIDAAYRDAVR